MVIINNIYCKFTLLILATFLFSGCAVLMPKAKPDYTVEIADMDFVFVKGGAFQMGSDHSPKEQPVHNVMIQDLFVGMYEVTFEQFEQFCVEPQCELPSDKGWGRGDRPAIHISWDAANAYAAWLSEQTGHQFRLPSESEWEYFARAGTTTAYWTGESLPNNSANCSDCGSKWDNKMTAPVGSFPPNPWGIYDTMGNVVEWVVDDYNEDYSKAPADGSPAISDSADKKGQRGGAWNYSDTDSRSSARDYRNPKKSTNNAGFRLVLVPQSVTQPSNN